MAEKARQYTIRNVPRSIDRALRRKAAARSMSLNSLVLRALEAEAGVAAEPTERSDLDEFIGSWVRDPAVDRALAEQRTLNKGDWD